MLTIKRRIPDFCLRKEKILSIIVYSSFSLILFIIAILVKSAFSDWYIKENGVSFFWTLKPGINGSSPIVWYIEAYNDARYYYVPYLRAFRFENWNPYAGGSGALNGYAYGPMFIYWLYLISLLVSLFNPNMAKETMLLDSVKWSHIVFDALSVPLLYIIITQLKFLKNNEIRKHGIAVLASLFLIVSPFNLFYVDGLWLNIPHMSFFTLLTLFLFIKKHYNGAALSLSIAWMSKQMPLFLFIPFFFIIWKERQSLKEAFIAFFIPFLLYTIIISLPWFYFTPYEFLHRVFGPGKPLTVIELTPAYYGYTVTLAHSFKFMHIDWLATFYAEINAYQIPFFFFYFIAVLYSYFYGKEIGESEELSIIFTTWVIILTHVFIARGIYKYYNAFLSPFVILSFVVFFYKKREEFLQWIICLYGKVTKFLLKKLKLKNSKSTSATAIELFGFSLFTFMVATFYSYSFLIIIKSRYLNPIFLLLLLLFVSLLLPSELYQTIVQKKKYIMIKEDIILILTTICSSIKKLSKKTTAFITKNKL